jgi:hypothetical protein
MPTPTTDQLEWFLKTGSMYGLGFILVAGLVGLALYGTFQVTVIVIGIFRDAKKWIPRAVAGYLGFVENIKTTNAQQAEASEKVAEAVKGMTASHAVSTDNHGRTHRALAYVAEAAKVDTTNEQAQGLLDKALKELRP